VVYHVAESRYGSSSSSMIEKGASIRKGQDILRLPDVSKMKVELKIHESKRWQVELGNKVAVYVGEHKFKGEVKMLKDVADSTSRWTGNKKVFRCEVVIENEQLPEGIRVGSTATCQIFVANLPKEYTDENGKEVKTLKVPIQSVIGVKGNKKVVFTIDDKGKPQPTIVETGLYDQTHIQIKGGKLKEGDVILKAPLLYAKEINVGGDMFDYRKISPEDLGLEVPVYDPTTDLEDAQAQAGSTRPSGGGTRPSGGGTRPSGGGTRPSGGGTRPSGGGGNSADAFKAPTELKLTAEQQQKWEGVAEFSKAAFDAAMEQRNFQELRTIREDFKKQIKGILTAEQMAQYEKLQPQRGGGGGGRSSGGSRRGLMDYDEDKDGKVSESEYGKMSERIRQFMGEFSALDSNGDGGITKDEADAARQRMMQRFQQGGGGGFGGRGGN